MDEKYNFKKISENRTAGVLLHISSLSNEYGIGSMGDEAKEFIDKLASSQQTWWQVLPIGPTGFGDSPYQSFSSFAGNPYFISLEYLRDLDLLTNDDLSYVKNEYSDGDVNFGKLYNERFDTLKKPI